MSVKIKLRREGGKKKPFYRPGSKLKMDWKRRSTFSNSKRSI